ncbi:DNA-binding transcriptional regulator, MocR family, contains an aminotransferase domain [Solimonas aquatica]|uniref:DNA-binding transcriptional regulator, MocR family, contains an aminotransferase domain n=1 Tax=Solimonas aquatica TaxID=489703 RepID=A0A1H9KEE9_9GAMM|nr:PLP-dependent aminotransferase family protein [Solimonas aquatica]SEQ97297.1 DNA-binding transcriptional regulator, MocR family, contains an aminotransferase domain [Solimonas aquatica]
MSNHSKRWALALRGSDRPAYLAIADAIAEDIQTGALSASQRLPTLRKLAADLKLNFTTVARGYGEAQKRGLIDARPGQGTVVRELVASQPVHRPRAGGLLDMTMNMPPEPRDRALLERLRQGLLGLAEHDPYELLRYCEFGGNVEEREAGAWWLRKRVPELHHQRVLLCPGVQSALLALFAVLARPGDSIACEAVTYPGIKGLATQLGIRLQGLPADDEGIDPDAFAALCAAEPPKALYCNPVYLNPTTAVMSLARRQAVVEIARRYSVPIIEDDAYGLLPSEVPPTLTALAPELSFYVTGFAKHLGAGPRVAYLCSPNARYAARLAATLRTTAVMNSPLSCCLARRWIQDGTVEAVTLAIREESRQRQLLARQILKRAEYQSKAEAFHLWLSVPPPWNRIEFAAHLRAHGVGVVIADTFTVSGPVPEAVRVCLGGSASREDCAHSLEIIEDAIEQAPELASRVL